MSSCTSTPLVAVESQWTCAQHESATFHPSKRGDLQNENQGKLGQDPNSTGSQFRGTPFPGSVEEEPGFFCGKLKHAEDSVSGGTVASDTLNGKPVERQNIRDNASSRETPPPCDETTGTVTYVSKKDPSSQEFGVQAEFSAHHSFLESKRWKAEDECGVSALTLPEIIWPLSTVSAGLTACNPVGSLSGGGASISGKCLRPADHPVDPHVDSSFNSFIAEKRHEQEPLLHLSNGNSTTGTCPEMSSFPLSPEQQKARSSLYSMQVDAEKQHFSVQGGAPHNSFPLHNLSNTRSCLKPASEGHLQSLPVRDSYLSSLTEQPSPKSRETAYPVNGGKGQVYEASLLCARHNDSSNNKHVTCELQAAPADCNDFEVALKMSPYNSVAAKLGDSYRASDTFYQVEKTTALFSTIFDVGRADDAGLVNKAGCEKAFLSEPGAPAPSPKSRQPEGKRIPLSSFLLPFSYTQFNTAVAGARANAHFLLDAAHAKKSAQPLLSDNSVASNNSASVLAERRHSRCAVAQTGITPASPDICPLPSRSGTNLCRPQCSLRDQTCMTDSKGGISLVGKNLPEAGIFTTAKRKTLTSARSMAEAPIDSAPERSVELLPEDMYPQQQRKDYGDRCFQGEQYRMQRQNSHRFWGGFPSAELPKADSLSQYLLCAQGRASEPSLLFESLPSYRQQEFAAVRAASARPPKAAAADISSIQVPTKPYSFPHMAAAPTKEQTLTTLSPSKNAAREGPSARDALAISSSRVAPSGRFPCERTVSSMRKDSTDEAYGTVASTPSDLKEGMSTDRKVTGGESITNIGQSCPASLETGKPFFCELVSPQVRFRLRRNSANSNWSSRLPDTLAPTSFLCPPKTACKASCSSPCSDLLRHSIPSLPDSASSLCQNFQNLFEPLLSTRGAENVPAKFASQTSVRQTDFSLQTGGSSSMASDVADGARASACSGLIEHSNVSFENRCGIASHGSSITWRKEDWFQRDTNIVMKNRSVKSLDGNLFMQRRTDDDTAQKEPGGREDLTCTESATESAAENPAFQPHSTVGSSIFMSSKTLVTAAGSIEHSPHLHSEPIADVSVCTHNRTVEEQRLSTRPISSTLVPHLKFEKNFAAPDASSQGQVSAASATDPRTSAASLLELLTFLSTAREDGSECDAATAQAGELAPSTMRREAESHKHTTDQNDDQPATTLAADDTLPPPHTIGGVPALQASIFSDAPTTKCHPRIIESSSPGEVEKFATDYEPTAKSIQKASALVPHLENCSASSTLSVVHPQISSAPDAFNNVDDKRILGVSWETSSLLQPLQSDTQNCCLLEWLSAHAADEEVSTLSNALQFLCNSVSSADKESLRNQRIAGTADEGVLAPARSAPGIAGQQRYQLQQQAGRNRPITHLHSAGPGPLAMRGSLSTEIESFNQGTVKRTGRPSCVSNEAKPEILNSQSAAKVSSLDFTLDRPLDQSSEDICLTKAQQFAETDISGARLHLQQNRPSTNEILKSNGAAFQFDGGAKSKADGTILPGDNFAAIKPSQGQTCFSWFADEIVRKDGGGEKEAVNITADQSNPRQPLFPDIHNYISVKISTLTTASPGHSLAPLLQAACSPQPEDVLQVSAITDRDASDSVLPQPKGRLKQRQSHQREHLQLFIQPEKLRWHQQEPRSEHKRLQLSWNKRVPSTGCSSPWGARKATQPSQNREMARENVRKSPARSTHRKMTVVRGFAQESESSKSSGRSTYNIHYRSEQRTEDARETDFVGRQRRATSSTVRCNAFRNLRTGKMSTLTSLGKTIFQNDKETGGCDVYDNEPPRLLQQETYTTCPSATAAGAITDLHLSFAPHKCFQTTGYNTVKAACPPPPPPPPPPPSSNREPYCERTATQKRPVLRSSPSASPPTVLSSLDVLAGKAREMCWLQELQGFLEQQAKKGGGSAAEAIAAALALAKTAARQSLIAADTSSSKVQSAETSVQGRLSFSSSLTDANNTDVRVVTANLVAAAALAPHRELRTTLRRTPERPLAAPREHLTAALRGRVPLCRSHDRPEFSSSAKIASPFSSEPSPSPISTFFQARLTSVPWTTTSLTSNLFGWREGDEGEGQKNGDMLRKREILKNNENRLRAREGSTSGAENLLKPRLEYHSSRHAIGKMERQIDESTQSCVMREKLTDEASSSSSLSGLMQVEASPNDSKMEESQLFCVNVGEPQRVMGNEGQQLKRRPPRPSKRQRVLIRALSYVKQRLRALESEVLPLIAPK